MALTVLASCLLVLCLIGISGLSVHLHGEKQAKEVENSRVSPELNIQEGARNQIAETEQKADTQQKTDTQGEIRYTEDGEESVVQRVEKLMAQMTTEQKVAQLFFVLPDSLAQVGSVTQVGDLTSAAYREYPVGGIVYMEGNILSEKQIIAMNASFTSLSREVLGVEPFLSVDEEGGTVVRIAGNPAFSVENVGSTDETGRTQDTTQAYQAGRTLGGYLSRFGFNMDFAPVADILVNPANTVVRERSFGSDPEMVADMVAAQVKGLKESGVEAVLKHFPGHGATAEDSHQGYAYADRDMEGLRQTELVAFQEGIQAGANFVMVGHICFPQIAGGDVPASLSHWAVTQLLKEELSFEGVAVTDAMNMGAIANHYSSAEAAVKAVQAGVDMVLMPADFQSAYNGVMEAVEGGEISQERLEDAVGRILTVKVRIQGS